MSKASNTAIKACYHIMRRYRESADFAYVMQMTESLELVLSAIAEHEGKPEMTFEERLADQQNVTHGWDHRVAKLEKEIAALEREVENAKDDAYASIPKDQTGESTKALMRVESLMRDAEFRGGTVTTEQLADAIAGNYVFL